MTSKRQPKKGLVRVLPLPNYYIPGVPHIPQDVTPERAEQLLSYSPPAFELAAEQPAPEPEPVAPIAENEE